MGSHRKMWAGLGMDLEAHDGLPAVLPPLFNDTILSQKGRPAGMEYFDNVFAGVHGMRIRGLVDHKKAGGVVVGTFCTYVPEELIIAVGGIAVGLCGGADVAPEAAGQYLPSRPRVLMTGCPKAIPNWKMASVIETSGAVVAMDEMCTGIRYFRNLVDEGAGSLEDMLDAVADRYLKVDCAVFTPNGERISNILDITREYAIDAVVYYALQFCDPFSMESYKVQKALDAAGIPMLYLETEYGTGDVAQMKTRVEALIEMAGATKAGA